MKTIPPPCPEPESGRKYWRSLDQLAETPEFRQWMEREFPEGASEWQDPVSRRHFVKIMSASFLLAGFGLAGSGCRRPEEKIMPFAKQPEGYIHGQPQYYATAMPTRTGAIPLVVKAHEGRPVKIEGNDKFPGGNGSTDRYAQASILNLYDPDRAQRFTKGGNTVARAEAMSFLQSLGVKFLKNSGEGLGFLAESSTSQSRARIQEAIASNFPKSKWFTYDPVDSGIHQRAATQAFGQPVRPVFNFDRAKVILSLDCDFLGGEDDAHNHIRRFARSRKLEKPADLMSRLYVVESLLTLTGANADHRLRLAASRVAEVAALISTWAASPPAGVPPPAQDFESQWAFNCANDLLKFGKDALVVAGQGQPVEVHLLAHAMNSALGAIGNTVTLLRAEDHAGLDLKDFDGGAFDTLVVLGGNPAYHLNWSSKPKTVVRLGYYEDETFEKCDWHFPMAHYLESWGDALTSDGTLAAIQPLIRPLFGGLTELEFLGPIAYNEQRSDYEYVRLAFRDMFFDAETGLNPPSKIEAAWKRFLFDGFLANDSAQQPVSAKFVAPSPALPRGAALSANNLEVVFFRDAKVDDGRYANNGWLQELPDPITKMVWDNAVLLSRKTASELGVKNGDVVEVSLHGRSVKGPIWVQPGMADYSLGLALGYGREKVGRIGHKVGFNAYALRTKDAPHFAVGATVRKTGETHTIACTQDHWSMEGRPIVREANLEQFQKEPGFAKRLNMHEPPGGMQSLYPNPLDKEKLKAHHQWGMSIDLNTCVGCSACVIACQSENNIPIVGKDQVKRGREMHWIRIDRYYASDPAKQTDKNVWKLEDKQQSESWIDDPQVVTQPMLCQHCEAAPCESVCPVNATVHDQEGLNVMAYNRCVGTRYCSNNCPFKVRRFNYFDYNKRPLNELYLGPLGKRKDDEWDLIKMIKNPDVTVRMRGVMEKCTFCIQRIEQAKIAQKVKARDSGDVVVPDGTFTTACAQACPAGAIVFGNIADPESRVAKLKQQERDYTVMEFLNIKPRTTYLARVRNPNPAMPDYQAEPSTLKEYEAKSGNPFETHGAVHSETLPTGHTVEKGGH